jgi:NADPH2 dehydrogenase
MKMKDPVPQFSYLLKGLKELKLAYVHLVESRIAGNADVEATEKCDPFIDIWAGTSPVFLAGGFTQESARQAVEKQYKDQDLAIVFGRYFIANPDLVFRMKEDIPFQKYNRDTFYKVGSEEGYTDYPYSAEWEKQHSKL